MSTFTKVFIVIFLFLITFISGFGTGAGWFNWAVHRPTSEYYREQLAFSRSEASRYSTLYFESERRLRESSDLVTGSLINISGALGSLSDSTKAIRVAIEALRELRKVLGK